MASDSAHLLSRLRAPEHEQFADMLDGRRLQALTQHVEKLFAHLPVSVMDAHLDQLVTDPVSYTHLDVYKRQIRKWPT